MRRTLSDWLTHAGTATDSIEVDRCLREAIARATSCDDWRTLLRGIAGIQLASREQVADVANRTLELAWAEREVWGFRDVAAIRATRLDDEAGARAALEAGATVFRQPRADLLGQAAELFVQPSARGYEWVLLAQGFVKTLQDRDGLRRCLEAGRDMARARSDADDLCDVAVAWAECVDRETGVALLLEAEALASNGSARPWTLANAWRSVDDPGAVHRVLDAALRDATSSEDAVHVASAWRSHQEVDEARRALRRAEELAATALEWLEIGESALDAGLGDDPVRHAVERAEALATDEDVRGRVSSAYKQWLNDEDAASRAGPRGVRPEALRERVRRLADWETSASGLFDWLRARATPDMLASIASADYGMNADRNLAALRDICETGLVPRRLGWEPHEVIALTRWSTGEGVDHLQRALCCVLLCLAPDDLDELVTNGPILAESCMALGAEASRLAELFFAWRSETEESVDEDDPDSIGPEQPIALLLLFLLHAAAVPDDPRLETLAHMLTEHPCYTIETVAGWIAGPMRPELWNELVDRILLPIKGTHPAAARLLCALRHRAQA
jgi:hypothetical protein